MGRCALRGPLAREVLEEQGFPAPHPDASETGEPQATREGRSAAAEALGAVAREAVSQAG